MSVSDFTNHVIDQYQLVQPLQQRPFTTLYLGQNTRQDETVFVEVMNQPATTNEELAGRFQRRLETVRQLDHPHIAPILQVGRSPLKAENGSEADPASPPPYVYAIIAYVPGPTLAAQLEQWRETDSWPDVPELLRLAHGLASALTAAHPVGLFHHDLRPDNVILGENGRLTLIDLGVPYVAQATAKPLDPANPPQALDYASPEQLEGKALSGPSNIYSLGIILYELLAGHPPQLLVSDWDIFDRTDLPREIPLTQVRRDLTEATYTVVKNCLWRQDWNRYETAVDLVNALVTAQTAEEKKRVTPPSRYRLPPSQWPYAAGLGLILLLIVIALFLL